MDLARHLLQNLAGQSLKSAFACSAEERSFGTILDRVSKKPSFWGSALPSGRALPQQRDMDGNVASLLVQYL